MENKNKHVFWQSLLIAIFIFALGIFLGYLLELNRTSKIIEAYQQSEINLLDVQIQEKFLSLETIDCESVIDENIAFADRVYQEALLLEKYQDSSRLLEGIVFQYKKYALLRTLLWMNLMQIKEKCDNTPNTVVYFFEFDSNSLDVLSQQKTISRYLQDLKNERQNEIILIPIAGNLDINSINYLRDKYGITELPSVLINEKEVISSIENIGQISNYLA